MTPESFAFLAELVKARSGIVLTADKAYMLETRLGPLLRREGLGSLDALALRLRDPRAECLARDVTEALTTNESSFFRDGRPFHHLRRVLPALARSRPLGCPLRIWSAGCSTGQEAYSVAMLLTEMAAVLQGRPVEILGTDISRQALQRARTGLYSQFEVQRGLPVQLLLRFFQRDRAGSWRISPEVRSMVRFEEWNLLRDPSPLGRFDVILCRNVLIYFDASTRAQVLAALAAQLASDGVLYLGGAETVLGGADCLAAVPGEPGIYEPARLPALVG